MINLIPPHARSSAVREYWTRVVSVWGMLFGGVALALVAFLVPTYLLLQLQLAALEEHMHEGADSDTAAEDAEKVLRDTNVLITKLSAPTPVVNDSELITAVLDAVETGISLSTYRIEEGASELKTLRVEGVAATRSALVEFQTRLERSPFFASADVPISDLAKETNAAFTVTLTISTNIAGEL